MIDPDEYGPVQIRRPASQLSLPSQSSLPSLPTLPSQVCISDLEVKTIKKFPIILFRLKLLTKDILQQKGKDLQL